MKKLVILSFILISTIGFSQSDSKSISFSAQWKKGDSYTFLITKVQKTLINNRLTGQDSSRYTANFKVIEATNQSYTIQYTFRTTFFSTIDDQLDALVASQGITQLKDKYNLSKVIYKTDRHGKFLEILNWKEISNAVLSTYDELTKDDGRLSPDDLNTFKKSIQPIMSAFSTEQGIKEVLLEELHHMHFPFGYKYRWDEPTIIDQNSSSIFGDIPIPTKGTITVENVDFANKICLLKAEATQDSEALVENIKILMEEMGNFTQEEWDLVDHLETDQKDVALYTFYYEPGVPYYIYASRTSYVKYEKETHANKSEIRIALITPVQ